LWRINLGWRRRADDAPPGYLLDEETGVWARNQATEPTPEGSPEAPRGAKQSRVVPYVEDRRNCLLVRCEASTEPRVMASLQAAFKLAVQTHFQLEDNELAAEPLPTDADRKLLLFYEASEGGAGVLGRVVTEPAILPILARIALERCHFDPDTGDDLKRAPHSREDCEAACYDCLLSYYNQRDHRVLDRHAIRDILMAWRDGKVSTSPRAMTREEHVARILRLCQSDLERRWVQFLADGGWNLPSDAQHRFEKLRIQADFFYRDQQVAVFVDGPHHDADERRKQDSAQEEALLDAGFPLVVRFHHAADWPSIVRKYPSVFGAGWSRGQA